MSAEKLEDTLKEELSKDDHKDPEAGLYFPSEITGCPLKVYLNRMMRIKTEINSYLFQGSAVHFYLQESGILDEALHNAGYHVLDTAYEVSTAMEIADGIRIHGSCDILCQGDESTAIFDIKYSSIPAHTGAGRIYKYYAQANTYAYLFDAHEYGLIMIHSQSHESDNFFDNLTVLPNEKSEDNWEITKSKTKNVHNALINAGYDKGNEWEMDVIADKSVDFWKEIIPQFEKKQMPAYEQECKYCDHKNYCPINQGILSGGLQNVINNG